MKPVLLLPLGLLLLLGPVRARGEEEAPSAAAYRLGGMARVDEMQGRNAEALEHLNQSIALVPDPIILSNRGDLKKKLGDIPGAIADYDKAIEQKPKGLDTLYGNRGLMKHESGDLDGAISDYSQVILLKPESALIYNNRGYAWITKGDRVKAIADYAKAAELAPKTAKFRENLANARRDQGDYAGAVAEYDKIIALDPKQPLSYYHRGSLRQLAGDFAGAIQDFDRLVGFMPKAWVGYFHRGTARQAQGNPAAALADYDKALTDVRPASERVIPYREIVLRQLKRGTPDAELAKIVAKGKAGFYNDVGLYLSGSLAESDFLAKARKEDPEGGFERQCMSSYFVGMARLLSGDTAAAREFLEQSVATKQIELNEFILARSELARLTKSK